MPALTPFMASPKKKKEPLQPTLQALPPPRPISFVLPVSALTQALRAKEQKPSNPLQRFAAWNAASEAQQNPIYLRIFCPFSSKPSKGLELPSRKDVRLKVGGRAAYLADAVVGRPWQFAPGFSKVMTVANNELTAVIEGKQTVNGMLVKVQLLLSAGRNKPVPGWKF